MSYSSSDRTVKPSTLTDVAKIAGVSVMTCSRVLQGKNNCTEETRTKVWSAAHEAKYCCIKCRQVKALPITYQEQDLNLKFCSRKCTIEFLTKNEKTIQSR